MKKKHKILAILLVTAILTNVFSINIGKSFAEDNISVEKKNRNLINTDFQYEVINDSEIELINYMGNSKNIIIPKEIDNKKVVSLGKEIFANLEIDNIVIPDTVKKLGDGIFFKSIINSDLVIPGSVKNIDSFNGILEDATVNGNIIFEEGVEKIRGVEFRNTKINGDVLFPSTINQYRNSTFKGSTINGRLYLNGNNGREDGHGLYKIDMNVIENAKYIETLEIDGTVELVKGATAYGSFDRVKIENLIFNEGLKSIGIFSITKILDVKNPIVFPETLEYIDGSGLAETVFKYPIKLPKSLIGIKGGAFYNSSVPLLEIEEGLSNTSHFEGTLGSDIFEDSNIRDIEFPNSLVNLGDSMFSGANFKNILISNPNIEFGEKMFSEEKDLNKEINLISYDNSTTKEFIDNIKDKFPNIKFKNFVEIKQTIDNQDSEIEVKQGDILNQKAEIKINESQGYNNLDRSVDRHINITINEDLGDIFEVNDIKVFTDNDELLESNIVDNKIEIKIPKNKFYGNKIINLETDLKIKENGDLKENEEIVIKANISDLKGENKEILNSNIIKLKKTDVFELEGQDLELNVNDKFIEKNLIKKATINSKDATEKVKIIYPDNINKENITKKAGNYKITLILGDKSVDVSIKVIKKNLGGGGIKPPTNPIEESKVDSLILANGYRYTDVLTATVLGNELNTSILLTEVGNLDSKTKAEIERLNPKEIIVSGGESSVSKNIENKLKEEGYEVRRLSGVDRYETAKEIAKEVRKVSNVKDKIMLADGTNFPDVITISTLASENHSPILLTEPNSLKDTTKKIVKDFNIKDITIAGGENSVSKDIEKFLNTNYKVKRIGGEDRYKTASLIAREVREITGNKEDLILVDGTNFPDGITINSLAGKHKAPIHLTKPNNLEEITKKDIKDFGIKNILIGGGRNSVSKKIENSLKNNNIKVERVSGADRFETAVNISKLFTKK